MPVLPKVAFQLDAPRKLRQPEGGTPQQRRHSCFSPELLRPATRVATSNGMTVRLSLHHLLPLQDCFRQVGGMGREIHCRRRLPGTVVTSRRRPSATSAGENKRKILHSGVACGCSFRRSSASKQWFRVVWRGDQAPALPEL